MRHIFIVLAVVGNRDKLSFVHRGDEKWACVRVPPSCTAVRTLLRHNGTFLQFGAPRASRGVPW